MRRFKATSREEKLALSKVMPLWRTMSVVHGPKLSKAMITGLLTFSSSQSVRISVPSGTVIVSLTHLPPGGIPSFSFTKGFVISPPNLVTQSLLNVLETLPSPHPKIITISSAGITHTSHKALPLPLKPLYGFFLSAPHKDKRGAEEAIAHCAGWSWDARDSAGDEILGVNWETRIPSREQLKSIVVVRPALLTDGECRADVKGSEAYRVKEGDMESIWTVSRRDVAHFLVEGVVKHWQEWEGKCVSIAY
jgi:hypothetical protein